LDYGLTRLNESHARINADNSDIDLQDKRLQVTSEIRQVYGDFGSAQKNFEASKRTTIAATKAYQIVEGRYKVGASSFVDLIAAQAVLIQAQMNEAQARIGFKFQSELLSFYLGKTPVVNEGY
jgi:outer membrane protein TolC